MHIAWKSAAPVAGNAEDVEGHRTQDTRSNGVLQLANRLMARIDVGMICHMAPYRVVALPGAAYTVHTIPIP